MQFPGDSRKGRSMPSSFSLSSCHLRPLARPRASTLASEFGPFIYRKFSVKPFPAVPPTVNHRPHTHHVLHHIDLVTLEPFSALVYINLISPALDKVEHNCPSHPEISVFAAALDQWAEWASQLEEFFWDYGNELLGSEAWIPATNSVGDYKLRILRLRNAVRQDDKAYLQSVGIISDESTSTVDQVALRSILLDQYVLGLLTEARTIVDDLNGQSGCTLLPVSESPLPDTFDDEQDD